MFFVSLVVACVATSVQAAITLDGRIGDWEQAGLLKTDPSNDRAIPSAAVEMLRSGATVENGIFYAVLEIDRPVSDFNGVSGPIPPDSTERIYACAFINVDHSASTALGQLTTYNINAVAGADILLEWGRNRRDPPVNFWGAGDDVRVGMTTDPAVGASGAACADTDGGLDGYGVAGHGVLEWSCPVSSIVAALATLPDNVTTGNVWSVGLATQGLATDPAPLDWGYDYNLLQGDADYNHTTDATDLNTVLSYYNQAGTGWSQGNFDGSASGTDATDLNTVLSYYNQTTDVVVGSSILVSTVPEPSSIAMLAALSALLGAWIIRRR